MMKKRKFSRDVAVQIMYQLDFRATDDYAKLLSHYKELCESGEYASILRTFSEGFPFRSADENSPAASVSEIAKKSDVQELDMDYLERLFSAFFEHRTEIDEEIKANLRGWTFSRIALMDLSVLRVALSELMYMDDIPGKSTVNEAVEIARRYGDEKSSKFVNGLLAHFVRGE